MRANSRSRILTRASDRVAGGARFALIFSAIVGDSILDEVPVLGAELMMVLRWARDALRYDLRWTVQEKLRTAWTRHSAAPGAHDHDRSGST
jgi:hypothetical protein